MPETLASSQDGIDVIRDTKDRIQIWEDDGSGTKKHISQDKVLTDRGFDPADSAANYALRNQEQSTGNPEIDALRHEIREMEANNERRHQEMMAVLQALVEKLNNNGNQDPTDPTVPPGSRVGAPEDDGMDRMRTHFSMLDGEENEDGPDDDPEDPKKASAEKLAEAEKALEVARNELVIYTIRRRARAGDGLTDSRREDKESYDVAMAQYKEAIQAYLQAMGENLDLGDPDNPEAVLPEQEIQRRLFKARYDEMLKFKEAEHSKNEKLLDEEVEAGGLRKFKAKVLRKWANYSTKKKILLGLGIGGGAALASGTLGLGLAAIAAGSAVKFSLGLLNRSASARNISEKSYKHEVARIEKEMEKSLLVFNEEAKAAAQAGLTLGRESMIRGQLDETESKLDRDVSRAQWRNRLGNTLLLLGASSAAYGVAHLAGDHLPDFRLWPGPGPGPGPEHHPTEFSLKGIGADQIHARTPAEFQHGVLSLLERQGVRIHGATPERIMEMTKWMDTHHIASGMARGSNGELVQNITAFPRPGEHFSNYLASAEQGFKIGANGNGTHALDQWIRHAQSLGMKFERVEK